jgi:hypothetical protein
MEGKSVVLVERVKTNAWNTPSDTIVTTAYRKQLMHSVRTPALNNGVRCVTLPIEKSRSGGYSHRTFFVECFSLVTCAR